MKLGSFAGSGRAARAVALAVATTLCSASHALAEAQPAPPRLVSSTAHGDWIVQCFEPASGQRGCQVFQRLLASGRTQVAMVSTMAWDAEGKSLRAQFALPLGLLLNTPPVLSVGETSRVTLQWKRCVRIGCLVETEIPPDLLAAMTTTSSARITVALPDGKLLAFPISLGGFSDAIAAISPAKRAAP